MVKLKKRLKSKLKRELTRLLKRDVCAEEVRSFMGSDSIRLVSSKKVKIRGGIDFQAIEGSVFRLRREFCSTRMRQAIRMRCITKLRSDF
jgi:hypothetical protein